MGALRVKALAARATGALEDSMTRTFKLRAFDALLERASRAVLTTRMMAGAGSYIFRRALPAVTLFGALCASCGTDASQSATVGKGDWSLILHDLPAALMSVSGKSPSEVWTVGALLDDQALVLHYDGKSWTRVRVDAESDLWWVDVFDDGTIFMGGDRGTIVRGDGSTFSKLATPDASATIYGVWGSSPDDMWAVGTDGTNGVVWRSSGDRFDATDVDPALVAQTTLFKVWGRSADDVWMVGDQGRILHYDGSRISAMSSPSDVPLTTVNGTDSAVYAVGGLGGSVILGLDSDEWRDLTPPGAPSVNGVFARDDVVYVVGRFGEVLKRTGTGPFARVETGLDLARDYHAVWIDQDGGVWAVGGHVNDAPLVQGLLSYSGATPPTNRPPKL
jgi:hypothetical protein